jgi:LPXTG-motif cell wall-anchored protein
MDSPTIIRIVAIVLAVFVLGLIIYRRKKK